MQPIESDVLLQEPIPYRVTWKDGTKETFLLPRLGVDGLIPWLDELTKERQAVSRAIVSKMKLSAIDAHRAEKAVMLNDEAVIGDLHGPVQRPAGIRRVISASLAKTELTPERQSQVLESIMGVAHMAALLAQRLSTLFYFDNEADNLRNAEPKGGTAQSPLAQTGQSPSNESPTTGSASESP